MVILWWPSVIGPDSLEILKKERERKGRKTLKEKVHADRRLK